MDRTGPGGFSGDCRASRSDQIRNTAVALPCVETGAGTPLEQDCARPASFLRTALPLRRSLG